MTIETRKFENFKKLMSDLDDLASQNDYYVFRGHRDASWKIESTFARHTTTPYRSWDSIIDEMLSHFIVNALSIGTVPFPQSNRRARLEYGRHYGVPTPLIDFSWSPYVALYFAFTNIHFTHDNPVPDCSVYALNIRNLAHCWSDINGDKESIMDRYNNFLLDKKDFFKDGYPENSLAFLRFPASWNQRMQRQLGCFIYDTLDYAQMGEARTDFEGLVNSFKEPSEEGGTQHPTLIKFVIPHSEVSQALSRLELMNINGTKLLDTEGLATDVKSAYNYNRKTGYAWDIEMPPPDRNYEDK